MTIAPGVRLGSYELLSTLGSGGMGQVYLAKDTRLAREVALKILPEDVAGDRKRLTRFENEARAASALNHPNIVTIYDFGRSDSVSWIAMERVQGKTLRELLTSNALPLKRLLSIAVQIADGLAKAHEAGIVHRDLKPENVMLTKDDRVKVLDFGLAKLAPVGPAGGDGSQRAAETGTFPGMILGTVGYMSPEQAQGAAVDFRSDQFSFGSLLYEMATGRRAFQGKTAVDTLAAIINYDPEPIGTINSQLPGPVRWLVERCLSKEPSHRYSSTQDLARELSVLRDHLTDISGTVISGVTPVARRPIRPWALLTAAAVLAGLVATWFLGRRTAERPIPDFQRLTFRRGVVSSARFAPDGRTIVYAAQWGDEPMRLFSTRTDGRDSTRLELPGAGLFAVSSLGEMALSLDGTLARADLAGGAPRELIDGVTGADWTPDGKSLAIVRHVDGEDRLEFPIGKTLYQTHEGIRSLRFSPGGDLIAFLSGVDTDVAVVVVDLAGRHRVLSHGWKRGQRLAWSPDGSEVWFSTNESGWRTPIHAVSLKGRVRLVMREPGWLGIHDVSRDGRVLVTLLTMRSEMRGFTPGESEERDLSWHVSSFAKDLTSDGKTLLFDEGAEGEFHAIYIRPTDGSPAKRIGEGRAIAISPDGRWVASNDAGRGSRVVLLPTGAGEPQVLDTEGHSFAEGRFSLDGKRLLLAADDGPAYIKELPGGSFRQVAPEGYQCGGALSPDGGEAACTGLHDEGTLMPLDGGPPRPIPGFKAQEDRVLQWSADGRSLIVANGVMPLQLVRLDLATGRRAAIRTISPIDHAGLQPWYYVTVTPDARFYAYSAFYTPSDLYLVSGLE